MTDALVTSLARWIDTTCVLLLFGATLYPLYAPTGRYLDRPLRQFVIAVGGVGILAALVWLGGLLVELAGGGDPAAIRLGDIRDFLLNGRLGHLWLAHLILSGLALAIGICLRRNSWTALPQGRVLLLVALVDLIEQTVIAHGPVATGLFGELARTAHGLHLIAAGTWLGGLVPLGLVLVNSPRASDGGSANLASRALHRSVLVLAGAAFLLVATGVFDAVEHIGSAAELSSTEYGRELLLKGALFALMAVLLAVRAYVLLPRVTDAPRAATVANTVRLLLLEGALGLAAIGWATILALSPPV